MPASMQSVTTRGFGTSGGFAGAAGLVVTMGYGFGEEVVQATVPGEVFRRRGADVGRAFRRRGEPGRVFRRRRD